MTLRAAIALSLLTLGLGAALVGAGVRSRPPAQLVSPATAVNAGALDLTDLRANNSPGLVRNPRNPANLAVASRVDAPAFSCRLHVSFDSGTSWSETTIPAPAGEEPKCFAPDVAFSAGGRLHLSFVTLASPANAPNAAWVVSSTDGGHTLGSPQRVLGPLAFGVRLAADPADPDRLYLTWLQAAQVGTLAFPDPGYPINAARSDDGGTTWSAPARVSPTTRDRVVAATPAATPTGLVVAYLDLGDDSLDYHGGHQGQGGEPYDGLWKLVVARSSDGGRSWAESVAEDNLVPTRRFVVFTPPTPSVAAAPDGADVYVTFADGRLGDADVWVWSSTDGGASWRRPARVNDTTNRDGLSQDQPAIAVNTGGRLDVAYLDRRADPDDVMAEVSLQSSYDGGRTFTSRLRLSGRSFDTRVGFGGERGLADLGSRLGLTSTDAGALAVWTDTRAGNDVSLKQDLARAWLEMTDPKVTAATATALQALGAVVLLAGAALAWSGRKPTRPYASAGSSRST